MMHDSVGIVGCGTIGSQVFRALRSDGLVRTSFLYDADRDRARSLDPALVVNSLEQVMDELPDLVVEAAVPSVVGEYGPRILERTNLLIFSITALADEELARQLESVCVRTGHALYLPHGAIAGVDGLQDANRLLADVCVTTTKPPHSLGRDDAERTIVFDGRTRDVCPLYPRNVNVHAIAALAGMGMDRTRSRLVSAPGTATTCHVIEATGEGFRFRFEIEARSGAGVTSTHTPDMAAALVRRVCRGPQGLVFV